MDIYIYLNAYPQTKANNQLKFYGHGSLVDVVQYQREEELLLLQQEVLIA